MNPRAKNFASSPRVLPMAGRLLLTCSLGIALAALAGCAEPRAQFDACVDRADEIEANKPPAPPTACPDQYEALTPGQADGKYLIVLSPTQGPESPILFAGEVITPQLGDGVGIGMSITPLNRMDRVTPIGEAQTFEPTPIGESGKFTYELSALVVPKDANTVAPVLVEANITLTGFVCGDASFSCGDVAGSVYKPSMVPLDGSTFTFMRANEDGTFPDPVINCEETPAKALE